MKKIIYTRPDGGLSVVNPSEGFRLATKITLPEGVSLTSEVPQPADRFLRRWPVAGAVAEWAETEEEWLARVRAKSVPADALNVRVVDEDAIPKDRTFRNAWEQDGKGGVAHNMAKCRELHCGRLRELRAPLLAALDVEYQRADEADDAAAKASVVARKQALRDVTDDPALVAAKTPEALKACIPEALK